MIFILSGCGQAITTWQEQYDLAVRYLSEGNYEEAIIAFTAAIEIDPKQATAYVGRGDAYSAQGEQAGVYEDTYELYLKAVADYEQAVALGESGAQLKLDNLQALLQQIRASTGAEPLLKDLYALLNENDIEGAKSLMRQQEYRAMSAAAEGNCFTYSESGDICLAVYGNNCYYFGQWVAGQRNGHGLWIQAAFEDDSVWESRQYNGDWSNDLPNGDGEILAVKNIDKIQLEEGQTTSIRTEINGSFKNGLYDGIIEEIWSMNDGDTLIWTPITAVDGVYQPMSDIPEEMLSRDSYQGNMSDGMYLVAVEQQNPHTDLWDDGSQHRVFGLSEE